MFPGPLSQLICVVVHSLDPQILALVEGLEETGNTSLETGGISNVRERPYFWTENGKVKSIYFSFTIPSNS